MSRLRHRFGFNPTIPFDFAFACLLRTASFTLTHDTRAHTRTHTHTHTLSLSLSLASFFDAETDAAVQAFNDLKYGDRLGAGRAQNEFKSMFPKPPASDVEVDKQQRALLDQQQRELERLRQGVADGHSSVRCACLSETFFVSVEACVEVGTTAQADALHIASPLYTFFLQLNREFSQSAISRQSFNIDDVARRNQQRLQDLQRRQMQDTTDKDATPDELIQRFLKRDGACASKRSEWERARE